MVWHRGTAAPRHCGARAALFNTGIPPMAQREPTAALTFDRRIAENAEALGIG